MILMKSRFLKEVYIGDLGKVIRDLECMPLFLGQYIQEIRYLDRVDTLLEVDFPYCLKKGEYINIEEEEHQIHKVVFRTDGTVDYYLNPSFTETKELIEHKKKFTEYEKLNRFDIYVAKAMKGSF